MRKVELVATDSPGQYAHSLAECIKRIVELEAALKFVDVSERWSPQENVVIRQAVKTQIENQHQSIRIMLDRIKQGLPI